MRRLLVVLVGIVVVLVMAVAYFGVFQVPVLSAAFGIDRARDLGMAAPDRPAFDAFTKQWGIEMPSNANDYTLSSKHHWSGKVQIKDGVLTEAALASIRELNAPDARFKQIQFRIHDGSVEMSAFVNVPGYPLSGPVYGKFALTKASATSVKLTISQLDYGRVGVPGNVADDARTRIESYLNENIAEAGIKIDSLAFEEGRIKFSGTWPKTISVDPPNANDVP